MGIKAFRKKERTAIDYDGSSMDLAYSWASISASGTSGKMSDVYYGSGGYYGWVAVNLTAGTAYSSTFGGEYQTVELYDAGGTKLASSSYELDYDTWDETVTPLSYTPETSGTYYLKFIDDWYEPEYSDGLSVNFSPRPGEDARPVYYPYETSGGVDFNGKPKTHHTLHEAGLTPFSQSATAVFLPFSVSTTRDMGVRGAKITNSGVTLSGGAAVFDGESCLRIGMEPGDLMGDFTLQAWVKTTSSSEKQAIFAGTKDCRVGLNIFNGKWSMWAGTGSWDIIQCDYEEEWEAPYGVSDVSASKDTWTHVAMVHNGTGWKLFVNGTLALSKTKKGNVNLGINDIYIGRWGADNDKMWFTGEMDDVRIDNKALYTANFTPPPRTARS